MLDESLKAVNQTHTIRFVEPTEGAPAPRVARLPELARQPLPDSDHDSDGLALPGRRRGLPDDVTRRLLRGRENGAREGKHQSGTAPFGYVRDYEARGRGRGVPLKLHPGESEVVRSIFEMYMKMRSMKRVVEHLNATGVRTRRGKEWSRAGIAWMLKNETYVGRVHFGNIRAKGRHEPIVQLGAFQRIQRLIRKNDKRGRGEREVASAGEKAVSSRPE
jgi:hypothetical protein